MELEDCDSEPNDSDDADGIGMDRGSELSEIDVIEELRELESRNLT